MSDIGGILGLFIGFSVLTIAEFFELGLDLLVLFFARMCSSQRRSSSSLQPLDGRRPSSSSLVHPFDGENRHHHPVLKNHNPTGVSPPPPYTNYSSGKMGIPGIADETSAV